MHSLTRSDLRVYQRAGIQRTKLADGIMLSMDPGLGKTGLTLTAIRDLLDCQEVSMVLIVAPLLVAEETWPAEIENWTHTRLLTYEVLTGAPERRESRARKPADIHIVNKENLSWLVEFWGDNWPYDMLVLDESSTFKNPKKFNKPTKKAAENYLLDPANVPKPKRKLTRFGCLCKVRKHFDKVVLLTGTVAPNGLLDLWSQYYLIDGGKRLGDTYEQYRRRWFESDYNGFKWFPRPGALEEITKRIADVTFSLKAEDWLELPPRIDNIIKLRLPEKVMKQYKQFERTMLLEEHDIEAINNGVLTGKLLQLANGSVYDEDGADIPIHDLKLQALEALVEEANGKPMLIAYSYQFDLARLRKKYPNAVVLGEQEGTVAKWNRGEIEILLAHPASASYGLNLQHGGHISVWYGLPWSLEYYIQFNARLHRSGQTESVIIHHILCEGTVDERVLEALREKDADQEAVIRATLFKPELTP